MAYAQQFENDIFISYAHADNQDPLGDGWITLFRKCLEVRLQELTGVHKGERALDIWRDPRLEGNEKFADVLVERAKRVALMVSVVSPSYVGSPWCKREVEIFCSAAGERLGLTVGGHKQRVIKVVKDYVPRDRHPEALQTQIGYEFYRIDQETKRPQQFTLTRGDDTTAVAKRVIDDLAHGILETLDAINAKVAEAAAAPASAAAPGAAAAPAAGAADAPPAPPAAVSTVYLAETHFSLDEVRQQLRRELTDRGLTVLPAGDLPVRHPQAFETAVRQDLERCALSVHLIGPERALMLPGSTEDTVALQDRYAAERAAAGLRRLVWLPPELVVAEGDAPQRAFVEALEREPRAAASTEVIRAPLHALLDQIRVTLERQRRAAEAPPPPDPGDAVPPGVYLISNLVDEALAQQVAQHLFDRGFDVLAPAQEGTEEERAQVHRMHLENADAVLVVVGAATDFWLQMQLSEVRKAAAWRNGRRFAATGLYMGPPAAAFKRALRQGWRLVDGTAGFAAEGLSAFAQAARPATAAAAGVA